MKYLIADLETQTHQRFKRKANPFLPENYIVARGWKKEGDPCASAEFYDNADSVPPVQIDDDVEVYVAHNAKFELLYEMRFSYDRMRAFFKRGGRVWCTQYAEYLLNGQDRKYHMNALDDVAPVYGGRVKVDGVKLLWEQGVQTADIVRDLLLDYLIGTEEEGRNSGDIGNTELIYKGQVKAAKELGMYNAILARMDGLCCTAEMEFNGLKVDVERARADLKKRTAELAVAEAELNEHIKFIPEEVGFNWGSKHNVSCLIFGGTIKYQKREPYIDPNTGELARKKATEDWPLFNGNPVEPDKCTWSAAKEMYACKINGVWKPQDTFLSGKRKGEPRYRKVDVPGEIKVKYQDFFYELPGITEPDPDWKSSLTDGVGGPIYSTSAEVIDQISNRDIPFLKALGNKTRLDKEIGTYYLKVDDKGNRKGMLTCVQPWDHMIHHKLNHTSTVTSRLSSSDPNMQNVTRADFDSDTGLYKSEVKAMFVSRFGDDGEMIEIDYSQLEVVVQGLLSLDDNLVTDLNNNVDFHCKRVALKNSVSYDFALFHCKKEEAPDHPKWKKERTRCKIFSFQRAYGAGAVLIADSTGMDLQEVKDLMEAEDEEYPGVVRFNRAVEAEVLRTAVPFRDKERGYRPFRRGSYQAPTGTLYNFRSYDAPDYVRKRGIMDTFSPTEMKNYPVQGTGGELVQLTLGKLWRWFIKTDNFGGKALLVNTVHDCVWADTKKEVRDQVVSGMKRIMEAIPYFLKTMYNMECPVRFPVDAETGPNMLELHHWEPAA